MPWHTYQFFVACFQCLLLMAHLFSAMRLRHLQHPRHCFYGSQSNSNEIKGADIFGLIESILLKVRARRRSMLNVPIYSSPTLSPLV
jgi:hypothetical protein